MSVSQAGRERPAKNPSGRAARHQTRSPAETANRTDLRVVVVDGYVPSGRRLDRGLRATHLYHGQIRSWVASRGWRVGRMFDECSLQVALERVESRETDGLIVARFSHLGSSLADALAAIERIQAAGGRFASVADGIDLDTPNGRLLLRLLLSVLHQNQERS